MSFGGLMKDQKYFENTKNTLRASKSFQICGLRNMTNFKDCLLGILLERRMRLFFQ